MPSVKGVSFPPNTWGSSPKSAVNFLDMKFPLSWKTTWKWQISPEGKGRTGIFSFHCFHGDHSYCARRWTTASYVAIMSAVFGICRTSCVHSPEYRARKPSSLKTVLIVCTKVRYLLPSCLNRVRATSEKQERKAT